MLYISNCFCFFHSYDAVAGAEGARVWRDESVAGGVAARSEMAVASAAASLAISRAEAGDAGSYR